MEPQSFLKISCFRSGGGLAICSIFTDRPLAEGSVWFQSPPAGLPRGCVRAMLFGQAAFSASATIGGGASVQSGPQLLITSCLLCLFQRPQLCSLQPPFGPMRPRPATSARQPTASIAQQRRLAAGPRACRLVCLPGLPACPPACLPAGRLAETCLALSLTSPMCTC